jgi:hypothetical protein
MLLWPWYLTPRLTGRAHGEAMGHAEKPETPQPLEGAEGARSAVQPAVMASKFIVRCLNCGSVYDLDVFMPSIGYALCRSCGMRWVFDHEEHKWRPASLDLDE